MLYVFLDDIIIHRLYITKHIDKIKEVLMNLKNLVLMHFNREYKIKLVCNASSYNIGGVIFYILSNKKERPIAMFLGH